MTPSTAVKGLVFWPVPEFGDAECAFGAGRKAFFDRHDLPEVPREFIDDANRLFFSGGRVPAFAPVVERKKAMRALHAWLCSFEPTHEAKVATVGYALWLWSMPDALEVAK